MEPIVKHLFEFHGFFPRQPPGALPIVERAARDVVEDNVKLRHRLDRVAVLSGDGSWADRVQQPALAVPRRVLLGVRHGCRWHRLDQGFPEEVIGLYSTDVVSKMLRPMLAYHSRQPTEERPRKVFPNVS